LLKPGLFLVFPGDRFLNFKGKKMKGFDWRLIIVPLIFAAALAGYAVIVGSLMAQ
jgi:hypothetical protein